MASFTPFGKLYLINNVDIDVSYNHTYDHFKTAQEQENFFKAKAFKTVAQGTYFRLNNGVIKVPFLADDIQSAKYLMWKNDVNNKWYYAFVTSVDYVNPNTSAVSYDIDVIQTYFFDVRWKQSFVERCHTRRYNTDGTPVINIEDEGLDYGSSYKTLKRTNLIQFPDISFVIVGLKQPLAGKPYMAEINNIPTGLTYYVFPIGLNLSGERSVKASNGRQTVDLPTVGTALKYLTQSKEYVNNVGSVTLIPFFPSSKASASLDKASGVLTFTCSDLFFESGKVSIPNEVETTLTLARISGISGINMYEVTDGESIYSSFPKYSESKLLMYPYSFIELTDDRGDTLPLRMEYINGGKGNVTIGICGTISHRSKQSFLVKNYMCQGYNQETGIHDDSLFEIPVIDDYTASYLQSSSNSIRASQSANKNNVFLAKRTASNIYNTNTRVAQNTAVASGVGDVMGTIASIATLNVGGAVSSLQSGLDTTSNYINSTLQNKTQKTNAMLSANISYQNAQAQLMAQMQDAEQIPPTVSSMGSEFLYNVAHKCDGVYLYRKTLHDEDAERLTSYFKQYGYKVNKLMQPKFNVRKHFDYIKMTEPNVYGNIPMDMLMKIRDIYMKGITRWHGDFIGDYSLTNEEV